MLRCLVVLLTASLALAAVPAPVDTNMLFEGPATGKAVYKAFSLSDWNTVDCTVLMVTRDAAYIRVKDSVRVIDAAHYEIQRIEAVRDTKPLL